MLKMEMVTSSAEVFIMVLGMNHLRNITIKSNMLQELEEYVLNATAPEAACLIYALCIQIYMCTPPCRMLVLEYLTPDYSCCRSIIECRPIIGLQCQYITNMLNVCLYSFMLVWHEL